MRRRLLTTAFSVAFLLSWGGDAKAQPKVYSSYATCYNLVGTMADGTYTRARSIAHNFWPPGTRIRLVGPVSFHGWRRFVVRDTGPALADGHFDIWHMGYSCAAWGHRAIQYKLGWGRLHPLLARRVRGSQRWTASL